MDKLTVKNFGPIKDISIDVNDINIFIGPTSSGKSTVAKLIAIFLNPDTDSDLTHPDATIEKFKKQLIYYNIDFDLKTNTEIIFSYDKLTLQIRNNQLIKNVSGQTDSNQFWPFYIPAERMLLPNVGESLFGLMKNNVSISESLKEFGSMFELSRKNLKSFVFPFLHIKYEYSDKNNYLTLPDGIKIKLEEASSGFQSMLPLMLIMEHFAANKRIFDNCFVIEEPELNLYPSMQKSLIEFIISKVNHSGDRLIITTHSPYTLTAIDNLIQAKSAYDKHPELKNEIINTVPENLWIDFNKVSCYYFEDGFCRSTLDNEDQSIGPSNIDDVSEDLGKTFDRLLELKYHA